MKHALLSLLLSLACLSSPTVYADSTVTYGRAETDDVYLCSRPDLSTALFCIPQTYCVEIVSKDGEWATVCYAADEGCYRQIQGYCLLSQLTLLSERPAVVWLNQPRSVVYRADVGTSPLPLPSEMTVEAAFYGNYRSGAVTYSYVRCRDSFGYLPGATDYPLLVTEEPVVEQEDPSPSPTVAVYGVLGGLLVATLTAFVLSRRQPKAVSHNTTRYRERRDTDRDTDNADRI